VCGISSFIDAYKIYVHKNYAKIGVRGMDTPKYPEKIAAKVALIDVATGICFLGVIPAIKIFGAQNSIWVSCAALAFILFLKRKVIASGNSET
jgi:hypothetical protein